MTQLYDDVKLNTAALFIAIKIANSHRGVMFVLELSEELDNIFLLQDFVRRIFSALKESHLLIS